MLDTLHLKIKKEYAAAMIEDLIKLEAVEPVEEPVINLSEAQKAALDKELENIKSDTSYLKKWNDVKNQFKKA
jgi:hypothetical protein